MTRRLALVAPGRFALRGISLLALLITSHAGEILPPGHRPVPPGTHALVGGKVVTRPGEVLQTGTVVVRDGFIVAVGADVTPPADARVWDMKGFTIYAGFIDVYLPTDSSNAPVSTTRTEPIDDGDRTLTSGSLNFFGVPGEEIDPGARGPGYQLEAIRSQHRAVESYTPNPRLLDTMHELGFTAANIIPGGGLARGSSALVNLSPANPNDAIIKDDVVHSIAFALESGSRESASGSSAGKTAR